MHLTEEYAKHRRLKVALRKKLNKKAPPSNLSVKTNDSQNAGNKEQGEEKTKIWKTIEQLSKV